MSKESLNRMAIGCWTVIFIAVPLVYSAQVYEGALLPKLLALQLLLLPLFGLWIYKTWHKPIPSPPFYTALGIYLGLAILATNAAVNRIEAILQLAQYVSLALVPFAMFATLDRAQLTKIICIGAWAGLPISIIGLCQYWGWGFYFIPSNANPSATFYHRNAAAEYLIGLLPLAWVAFQLSQSSRRSIGYATLISLSGTFLIYTRTRGAWLGITIAFIVTSAMAYLSNPTHFNRHTLLSKKRYLILAIASFIALASLHPGDIQKTGNQKFDEKKTDVITTITSITAERGDRGRLNIWKHTVDMIRDHPLLGVGMGNWQYHFPAYALGDQVDITAAPQRPHNDFLWIASETGVLSLLAYLYFIFSAGRCGWQILQQTNGETRTLTLGLITVAMAHMIDGCFNFPREIIPSTLFFWFSLGGIFVLHTNTIPQPHQPPKCWRIVMPALLSFILLLGATYITYLRLEYDRHHMRVHLSERTADWQTVIKEGEAAAQIGQFRANTFIAMGRAYTKTGHNADALNAYQIAVHRHPNSLNAYNNIGIVYNRLHRPDEAIDALQKALILFPGFPEAANNLGNVYRDQKDFDKAIATYQSAIKQSAHPQIIFNLGKIYAMQGNPFKAQQSYLTALSIDPTFLPARRELLQMGVSPQALPSEP